MLAPGEGIYGTHHSSPSFTIVFVQDYGGRN